MSWQLIHGDARHVSAHLEPGSVDVIVTSPPYFALRSYRDGGEHYDGQIGSEPTPTEFVDALIACTADWLRVLRPTGSLFVNLGDKYAGSGGGNQGGLLAGTKADKAMTAVHDARVNQFDAPRSYNQASDGIRAKSLMGLPWRYANRCVDELGLILRAEIIWSKLNGLPESVTDRVRRSHEQIFHFTREGRYFAAIDEVREAHAADTLYCAEWEGGTYTHERVNPNRMDGGNRVSVNGLNPLGKAPGSVWELATEPLDVPAHLGVDHFAAFPSELPRRLIAGWCPTGYCTVCGEPRRPMVEKGESFPRDKFAAGRNGKVNVDRGDATTTSNTNGQEYNAWRSEHPHTITGDACACPDTSAPTRPAVVLDPFCGTGTTAAVAHLLGRHGVGVDLSRDYLRLAEWRCTSDKSLRDKVLNRSGLPAAPKVDGQLSLLEMVL